MMYKERERKNTNDLLSASKNFERKTIVNINEEPQAFRNTLSQKQILLVYIAEDERLYVTRAAAHALGLIDVRAIMLNGGHDLVEITKRQLASFEDRDNIEVEYRTVSLDQKLPERPKIKVYKKDLEYFIELGSAYALGLITVETFNAMADELYPVNENLLVFIQNKYDVEYIDLSENIGSRK